MQLQCKHCSHISKSLLIKKDEALAEITLDFSKHMTEKHIDTPFKQWMIDVNLLTQIAPCLIMISKHSTLLDSFNSDDFIQQKFSEMVDQVQDYLGIEVFDNKPGQVDPPKGFTGEG